MSKMFVPFRQVGNSLQSDCELIVNPVGIGGVEGIYDRYKDHPLSRLYLIGGGYLTVMGDVDHVARKVHSPYFRKFTRVYGEEQDLSELWLRSYFIAVARETPNDFDGFSTSEVTLLTGASVTLVGNPLSIRVRCQMKP